MKHLRTWQGYLLNNKGEELALRSWGQVTPTSQMIMDCTIATALGRAIYRYTVCCVVSGSRGIER